MTETAIKANSSEAYRLFQRGVAAARGGQRRVAVGLLTRSVQLDPHNEQSWLWLSGVLDDPQQVAFCLQSVLKLNPGNARAQQGLRWLEERHQLNGAAKPAPALDVRIEDAASRQEPRPRSDSWWVNWRQTRREVSRVRLILWSVPIVLLCLALVLYESFTLAVERSQAESIPLTLSSAKIIEDGAASAPMLEAEPASLRESLALSYLSALEPMRQRLRNAVDSYLNVTGQPGGASVGHVAAAQTLRTVVEESHSALKEMTPPSDLKVAHEDYLKGLELEMQALDAIAEFYSSYKVELANRAALRLQEANAYIDRARAVFDARKQQMQMGSSVSSHAIR